MIAIAIDGPSGAGKSSMARKAAKRFGLIYVDTGAMYRTIGLSAYKKGIDTKNADAVIAMLPSISIELSYNSLGEQCMFLDGEDVSGEIRLPEISMCASNVSAIPEVRAYLIDMQRDLAERQNIVMDGRDIGTVILPNAQLKIFLTASAEVRAGRRFEQLKKKGIEADFNDILREQKARDEQDTKRSAAPLIPADDAVILDTSGMDREESLNAICELIEKHTGLSPL